MIGHIDAVVVDHRDGKHHLPAARPFVEAGLPVFVDKPFCVDLSEGIEFTRFARARGVPIASFSTLPLQRSVHDFAGAMGEIVPLRALVTAGPLDVESPYGGVFFYGIHQVELMLQLVQAAPLCVAATRHGSDGAVVLTFDGGPVGVINALTEWWGGGGFHASAFGDEGVRHAGLVSDEEPFLAGVLRFCQMFSTGVEPDPPSSYLTPVAVLDAMQRSFDTGAAVSVESVPEF
jgi:predicted dehydrogenase